MLNIKHMPLRCMREHHKHTKLVGAVVHYVFFSASTHIYGWFSERESDPLLYHPEPPPGSVDHKLRRWEREDLPPHCCRCRIQRHYQWAGQSPRMQPAGPRRGWQVTMETNWKELQSSGRGPPCFLTYSEGGLAALLWNVSSNEMILSMDPPCSATTQQVGSLTFTVTVL